MPVVADLTREEEVGAAFSRIVERLGPVSILVNNASAPRMPRPVAEMVLAEWDLTLSTKLTAAMLCAREALSSMAPLGLGSIINISGTTGVRGAALLSAHSVAQAGLIAFSQSLAREVGPLGVRVNAVVPSAIAGDSLTRIVRGLAGSRPQPDGGGADLAAGSALGRIVQPQEVASVVSFLASDDSSGITGQAIPILLD
jgi:NAD(P)-dependent dehydrogenase (short-subunit alcohol dehydrogenase family)